MVLERPTPAYPTPTKPRDPARPGAQARALPPELGPNAIAVVSGATFMYSDPVGDVPAGTIGGLVHRDTRLLNHWVLTIDGHRLLVLRSHVVDHYSAQFFLTNPALPDLPANTIVVRRLRYLSDGLHERIEVGSFAGERVRLELRLEVGNDFADILEIKTNVRDRSERIQRRHARDGSQLVFSYEQDGFTADTRVWSTRPPRRLEGDHLVWAIDLGPRGEWQVDLKVPVPPGIGVTEPVRGDVADVFHHRVEDPAARWLARAAELTSDHRVLERATAQTRSDMSALRLEMEVGEERISLPAAGMPWFLAIFGRDTLITSYQALTFGPRMAKGTLLALAHHQGRQCEDFTDEEPGKILHEVRFGELTQQGLMPYNPNYGSADATQLWLVLLSEYWRWTRDDDLVRSLRDNARAAVNWIDRYGDRDGDGYVEYATRSPEGLGNQCWRDSWDGVRFADGRMPVLPIATCEIQGYTYDAKLRLAELADGPLADPALADRLRAEAYRLRESFNRDFWIEGRGGYYAVGLDGDKNKIDSMTSNLGHLLWSGIVPQERAAALARQLLSEDMFSGWGIRTLSRADAPYNALGYHLGTVWPHDSSISVLGLARYGFRDEANRVALALLDAAAEFGDRLPEAIAGFARERALAAIPYPTACSPQAWASGVPLNLIRAMLGLRPVDGRLVVDPALPHEVGRIHIRGVAAFGHRWDVEAVGSEGYVRLAAD
ncbi:glycogen debranching N-terminal domain-containing protein [Micromonospora sp. 4G57]|uniref:Glycogen debranching N-terminal domain-containing protein n=1 Tax=Micromonospora sicca TaxID=2202420 RepID=A0ABU5JEA6_9ACTN|nr:MULTISPECIES: glycogen debranching N-terminal domain-containing protein [unclassified Micromonospora]MDZ5445190.1 glycogen debranching N-terminal domain-containing protein [Micromonospora sp. 4G57]MDZ5490933.1 glycogen debranching N-terminal domain-containing protein [Micromonospora sp. 4G53]